MHGIVRNLFFLFYCLCSRLLVVCKVYELLKSVVLQAYYTIDGIPVDILITGMAQPW